MTYEMALALLIVILIIGSSFTIFRSTWGPVVRAVYEGIAGFKKVRQIGV